MSIEHTLEKWSGADLSLLDVLLQCFLSVAMSSLSSSATFLMFLAVSMNTYQIGFAEMLLELERNCGIVP